MEDGGGPSFWRKGVLRLSEDPEKDLEDRKPLLRPFSDEASSDDNEEQHNYGSFNNSLGDPTPVPPSLPPRPNPGQRKREEILVDMSRVHEITNSAISKFIGRGEDVKSLKSKSDGLGDVSGMFKKKAKETKVESQDKNVKLDFLIWLFWIFLSIIAAGLLVRFLMWVASPIRPPMPSPPPAVPPPSPPGGIPMPMPGPQPMMCYCYPMSGNPPPPNPNPMPHNFTQVD